MYTGHGKSSSTRTHVSTYMQVGHFHGGNTKTFSSASKWNTKQGGLLIKKRKEGKEGGRHQKEKEGKERKTRNKEGRPVM